jgi:hypothetical protein
MSPSPTGWFATGLVATRGPATTPLQRRFAVDSTHGTVRCPQLWIAHNRSVYRGLRPLVAERRDVRSSSGSQCSAS